MNYVIDITRDILAPNELISLNEAKEYLRVTDTAQDNVITLIIKGAREAIEKATGLCINYSKIKALLNNSDGMIELPMQPLNGMITTGLTFVGYDFLQLVNISEQIEVEYNAGYDISTIPVDLLLAIYDQIAFMYDNRGSGADTYAVCEKAWRTCLRYTRKPLLN